MKEVYLVHSVGDMGKDNFYRIFEKQEVAEKFCDFIEDEMNHSDPWYNKFSEEIEDENGKWHSKEVDEDARELICLFSVMDLNDYLKENDLKIAAEYEAIEV